ncbi:MAG TPA: DUF3043 domain-containing protein, partial [Jatrophihabitantaceae bacterium]
MKLLRRRPVAPETDAVLEEPPPDVVGGPATKGRPTPKRRDTTPVRGPVKAPKTRKEAVQWQRQQTRGSRTGGAGGTKRVSGQAHREALRRGDPDALPKRDRGPVRKLARDYVDSHRMISNYLLILFPLMIVGYFIPFLNIAVIALLVVIVIEWYLTGRRVRALAVSRLDNVREGPWSLGFYAGSRAYMPRRWR